MPRLPRHILNGLLLAGMAVCLFLVFTLKMQVTTIQSSLGLHEDNDEDFSEKLLHFQDVLSDSKRLPTNSADVEKLWSEFESLDDKDPTKMPVGVRRQLSAAKWCIAALSCLAELRNRPATEFDSLENESHQILIAAPLQLRISSVSKIREQLESELGTASLRVRQERMNAAKRAAEKALSDNKNLQSAVQDLEPFKDESSLRELWQQLQLKALNEVIAQRVQRLISQKEAAQGVSDLRLAGAGLARVLAEATDLYFGLADQSNSKESLATVQQFICDTTSALAVLTDERQSRQSRAYQKWALDQILAFDGAQGWQYEETDLWMDGQLRSFEDPSGAIDWILLRRFPSTREVLQDKLEIELPTVNGSILSIEQQKLIYNTANRRIGWKHSITSEIGYRTTRDGIVQFLLPINVALLEPPVAQFYSKAYERAWKRLDGHNDDQLFVAKQAALTRKKAPDDFD